MKWHRRGARRVVPSSTVNALRALDAKVRPDFRKAVLFGLIALAALVAGHHLDAIYSDDLNRKLASWGCVLVVVVFGVWSSRTASREVGRIVGARAGASAAAPLRMIVLLVGYLIALLAVLDLLSLPLNRFLFGGTIVALVLGIAAQQVLGNLFAGLVMLFARPYVPGEHIRVRSGGLGGPHEGTVTTVGLLYTTMQTEDGPLNIPNSGLLAAAVGPVPRPRRRVAQDGPVGQHAPVGQNAPVGPSDPAG